MTLNTNDHYVPQFYLRNFKSRTNSNESFIYVYGQRETIYETNIRNIASIKGFYTIEDKITKEPSKLVENLMTSVEDRAAPLINNKLLKLDLNLTEEERKYLNFFFALLYTRTEGFRQIQAELTKAQNKELIRASGQNKEYFRKLIDKTGINLEIEQLEKLRQSVINFDKHFTLEVSGGEAFFLKLALELTNDFLPIFRSKHYQLLHSDSSFVFCTSDNPVSIVTENKLYGKGLTGSILLPLSPTICLLLTNKPIKKRVLSVGDKKIRKINDCIIYSANKIIMSNLHSKTLQRIINNVDFSRKKFSTTSFGPYKIYSSESSPHLIEDIFNFD